ncbi:MAG: translesion DNA synthesis-associated protein ImuA [Chromatiales bacterium]|nr:translesion DNA synthesis-associated protein ImuA [Chromatiales bacterium]
MHDPLPAAAGVAPGLNQALAQAGVWRGGARLASTPQALVSGHAALDERFPQGLWPHAAVSELLGEPGATLRLLLPALARLSAGQRWIAWIAPPALPYAPGLIAAGLQLSRMLLVWPKTAAARVWALEQALAGGTCAAVLAWPDRDGRMVTGSLRRLQLAAARGDACGFLFRPAALARGSTPAALRVRLQPGGAGLDLHVLKRRGGWAGQRIAVDLGACVANHVSGFVSTETE